MTGKDWVGLEKMVKSKI